MRSATDKRRIGRPALAARQLIQELDIRSPDEIDVELMAAHKGAVVKFRTLAHEEGRLLHSGGKVGLIVVNDKAKRTWQWRFVIAHELGHLMLHQNLDQSKLCTDADLHRWYREGGFEPEANSFAAELLMPQSIFEPQCDRNRPSLHDVRELSRRFQTSLSSTALRFVHFSPEPCAVAYSEDRVIRWHAWSETFGFTLKRGFRLTTNTHAGDIFAGRDAPGDPEPVAADDWSHDSRAVEREVYEHSAPIGGHGVLTVLWHPED